MGKRRISFKTEIIVYSILLLSLTTLLVTIAAYVSFSKTTKDAKFKELKHDVSFSLVSGLTLKSVLYMINNETATAPITITLHADVYNKCMANTDILTALEQHTNISLASA